MLDCNRCHKLISCLSFRIVARYFHLETAQHTCAGWITDDIEREVTELKARGVVFEEYDMPGLKTVNSIAAVGPGRAAWFKDSEGNLLGLVQFS
jgi:hypothetical protein